MPDSTIPNMYISSTIDVIHLWVPLKLVSVPQEGLLNWKSQKTQLTLREKFPLMRRRYTCSTGLRGTQRFFCRRLRICLKSSSLPLMLRNYSGRIYTYVNMGAKVPGGKFPEQTSCTPPVRLLPLPSENDHWVSGFRATECSLIICAFPMVPYQRKRDIHIIHAIDLNVFLQNVLIDRSNVFCSKKSV